MKNGAIKFYGNTLRTWKHMVTCKTLRGNTYEEERVSQYELSYKEYMQDGTLIGVGSEDFSPERKNTLKRYRVFAWDGKKYNKGGYRWFENVVDVVVAQGNKKAAFEIVKTWFPDAALIELR